MRFALVQPRWRFEGSTYFGCTETHAPLELLFARQQLERAGHDTLLVDGHLEGLEPAQASARLRRFAPDFVVLTTAPTYLFWRCPQPELRVPARWMRELRGHGLSVAIGPHGSATPGAALRKLGCDLIVCGEPDEVLPQLPAGDWASVPGLAWRDEAGRVQTPARTAQTDLRHLDALDWAGYPLEARQHRHHVFSGSGRGLEVEHSRGCPWACSFCNKTRFRNQFRERPPAAVIGDIEAALRRGIDYFYFIDEIFGCSRQTTALLEALAELPLSFGMQTRIDLWDEDGLERLGRAHCISMECGIESITPAGRERFRKGCRLGNDRIVAVLRTARRHVPWVQANLIAGEGDDLDAIAAWRAELLAEQVWVSQPVPMYPYPGSPLYRDLFGEPDEQAWERAHGHYLASNGQRGYYSDIQCPQPQTLETLEAAIEPR